ncbi:hypothetical protein ADL22_25960 [Streptomyces sp. NRRL F-4489]|uniref:hypothetical protein n=1 Tax=Streptomyces sp. NRRL F-4489 TaxID=1609095 RepID=UPI000748E03E|nr:hypothetical protein [Streptomyces sp. NRRL F-4489]KUL36015.1 hypothetical protein ADL22_25960 [Streptomyces sp. NRRL F-4489]
MPASAPARAGGRGRAAPGPPARPCRARALAGGVLLVLGALLLPLSLAAVWARAELSDTDRYVAAVAPLAGNRAVQDAIVADVTNGVMPHIRLDGLLKAVPRAERPALRRKFTRGIREFVGKQVREVVTGRGFPAVWAAVHRTAHRSLDGALTATGSAPVTLDLTPVVARVRHQLSGNGLGIDIARRVPPAGATIVLLRSPDVPGFRAGFQAVRTGALLLPPTAALCLAAGLLLVRRRRRALIGAAAGCALACALLSTALALLRARVLDALPAAVSRSAADAYTDALTAPLRTTVWGAAGAAALVIVVAAAGPRAARLRRPAAGHRPGPLPGPGVPP